MGIFHHSGSSNHTCPNPNVNGDPTQVPIVGSLTFHHLIEIISGACMGFSCLIAFFLILQHGLHYSLPKEQRHIIRIIFVIPVFAILSFLSVAFESAAIYLKSIEDFYEAMALASFFLLLCAYIQEDDDHRQTFFKASGTLKSYISATIMIFQFPVVMFILMLATIISQASGTYCENSHKFYFVHIWVTIITIISTTLAIMSLLRFYKAVKPQIANRQPLSKLIAFKGIVFLNFIQNTVFNFLSTSSIMNATSKHTYEDYIKGLPNLLLSIEMAIFALLFLYVYRVSPYNMKSGASAVPLGHGGYQGGPLGIRAYLQALNISDILMGILSVPRLFIERRQYGDDSTGSKSNPQYYQNIQQNVEMPEYRASQDRAPKAHLPTHLHESTQGYGSYSEQQGYGGYQAQEGYGRQ